MKKVLFGLMALAIGMFSSCSNDEIPVDAPEAPVTDAVTITVDPSTFYTGYDYDDTWHSVPRIAEAYRTFNSESGKYIQVRTYIYDKNTEELVDSVVNYVTTTNPITTSLNLMKGEYYAITTVNFADQISSNGAWWHVYDRGKLSTAKLYPRNRNSKWSILSQSTESFSVVRGQHATLNTVPAPLGTLVYMFCQNFQYKDEATYGTIADNGIREISLYSRRKAESYNLDPNATSKYNFFEEGGANSWYYIMSFEPKDFDSSWTFFQTNLYGYCYILEPQQTTCFGYVPEGKTTFSKYGEQDTNYISGKTFLAYWDYFKIGNPYFGIADNNHWNSYTKPDPEPTYDKYYEDPYLGWGESKTNVKGKVDALGLKLSSEGDDYLIYSPKYKELYTYYHFGDPGLDWSLMCFDVSDVSLSGLNNYVASLPGVSYVKSNDNGDNFYITSDEKTIIVVFEYTYDDGSKDYNVEYYPASSTSRARGEDLRYHKEASLKARK